jgi:hypothetical protein
MFSFILKIFLVFAAILVLVVIIPNPIHNQFPQWIQKYQNYKDPHSNNMLEIDQLDIMSQDPLLCYKNADCELILCGVIPNCHSFALNKEFSSANRKDMPAQYQCPSNAELESDDCGKKAEPDTYAACERGQCIKKHLFPTPTPLTKNIIEHIVNEK